MVLDFPEPLGPTMAEKDYPDAIRKEENVR